jgi:hypothetical protein
MMVVAFSLLMLVLADASWAAAPPSADPAMLKGLTAGIHWLGHDSFRIEGKGVTVYIDPYRLKDGPKADLILVTHDHRDHASPDDVARILKPETIIVTISRRPRSSPARSRPSKPARS